MDIERITKFLIQLRKENNLSQNDLSEKLYISREAISKWERGVSYPDITLVPDICRVLEISEHELIASSHDVEYRKMKKDASKYNNMKKGTLVDPYNITIDVSDKGHRGNGDYRVYIRNIDDIDKVIPLIKQSLEINKK